MMEGIIQSLKNHYGIEVIESTKLPWGADVDSSVYKVKSRELTYFVKLKRGHHHTLSVTIARWLFNAGIAQIIPPVLTTQKQPTFQLDDYTLIVYPFVQGEDGFKRPLSDKQWIELGKTMKQVHEIRLPLSLLTQIRKENYSPKWREAIRLLYDKFEDDFMGDEIGLNLFQFMKDNLSIIKQLVDTAEHLSFKVQEQSPPYVLCHSDIHGGNVLIDESDKLYILDWDEPILAPKERDLMFIGGGVANVWNNPHEVTCFYQGYGKAEINKIILAYYRHERIVEDIAIYVQHLLLTTVGGNDRAVMYQHFIDMFSPNGVVDIALSCVK